MSNSKYIQDDFGNQIPLLDDYGNLSVQVIILYAEDKLTATDRKAVDDFAATDEMSKDALEGFLLTSNSSKTRHELGQLNADIQKASGAKAVSTFSPPKKDFDYRRLAAAIALLFAVGGGTFIASQFIGDDELADNVKKEEAKTVKRELNKSFEPTIIEADSTVEDVKEGSLNVLEEREETEPVFESKPDELKDLKSELVSDSPAKNIEYSEILEQVAQEEAMDLSAQEPSIVVLGADEIVVSADDLDNSESQLKLNEYEQLAKAQRRDKAKEEEQETAAKKTEENRIQSEGSAQLAASSYADSEMATNTARLKAVNEMAEEVSEGERERKMADNEAASKDEKPARFPGGDLEMYKFIEKNKQRTDEMLAQDIRGAIVVSFQISKEGKVEKAKIESGEEELLRADALRIVQAMPKWEPAKRANGNTVKSARVVVIKYD